MDLNTLISLFGECIVKDERNNIIYPTKQEKIDNFNKILATFEPIILENSNVIYTKDEEYFEYKEKKVSSGGHIYTASTLTNVSTLAKGVIEHYNKMIESYRTDTTTGLDSKGLVFEKFDEYLGNIVARNATFGVMYVDADHFKNVNDTYGHDAGDIILKKVSDILATSVRKEDLVGRLGGEEFIVVLKNIDYDNTMTKAEEIRKKAEVAYVDFNGTSIKCPTLSIGVNVIDASTLDKDTTAEDIRNNIISSADEACYQSKNNGRNQITVFDKEKVL